MKITVSFSPPETQTGGEQSATTCNTVYSLKEAEALLDGVERVMQCVRRHAYDVDPIVVVTSLTLQTIVGTWVFSGPPSAVLQGLKTRLHLLSREISARRKQAKELK